MKKLRALALTGALAIGIAGTAAFAAEPLRFGAMPLNTWWYVGGGAIASLVQSKLPSWMTIEVLALGGGIANPVVTNENKTQIAFSNVAVPAINGAAALVPENRVSTTPLPGTLVVMKFTPGAQPSLPDDWQGGFFCPCHGSMFDLAGRVYKNLPAPDNLEIPPHMYLSDSKLLIGEDKKA